MSAPTLKARSPAPVSTMQRQSSRSSSSHSRPSSASIARVMALRRGWLSMVTTTTCGPCRARRISISGDSVTHDDLAVRLAVGEEADGLHAPLERQAMADAGAQLALRVPAHQLVDGAPQLVRRVPAEVAQRRAERGAVLHEQPVGRDLRHAGHEADEEDAAAPAERRQRGVEEIAADGIEAHVGALVVRQRHHALGELLGRVVDEVVRAALAGDRELLGRARGRDHARAHRLADLDGGEPDAAGRAEHQQRLAGLEAALPAERDVARDVRDRKRARFVEAHAGGNGERLRLRCHRHLGEPAVGKDRHHAVARGEARDVRTARGDDAGGLQARAERQRRLRLVVAGHHDRVGVVHRRRLHGDQHLARARDGRRHVGERQIVDRSPLAAEHGSHDQRSITPARGFPARRPDPGV